MQVLRQKTTTEDLKSKEKATGEGAASEAKIKRVKALDFQRPTAKPQRGRGGLERGDREQQKPGSRRAHLPSYEAFARENAGSDRGHGSSLQRQTLAPSPARRGLPWELGVQALVPTPLASLPDPPGPPPILSSEDSTVLNARVTPATKTAKVSGPCSSGSQPGQPAHTPIQTGCSF